MPSRRFFLCVLLAAMVLGPLRGATAGLSGGIGVLGDSYSDEYRFYPPDRSTARNWVEILTETRGLNFGSFSVASRGEPRNQGFEFNWARSDATTDDLIASGQHTGVAAQVARGEVGLVFVFIGGNDFINALNSADPAAALRSILPRALANYRVAVRTVLRASPEVKLVLATLPDIRDLPEFAGPIREGRIPLALADAYTAAQRTYNAQIRSTATSEPRIAVIDLDLTARVANLLSRDYVTVAGRKLDRRGPANDLGHFFLADFRHPGTLAQGLLARMFVEAVNVRFGAGIEPIRDQDLLAVAASLPAVAPRDDAVRLCGLATLARWWQIVPAYVGFRDADPRPAPAPGPRLVFPRRSADLGDQRARRRPRLRLLAHEGVVSLRRNRSDHPFEARPGPGWQRHKRRCSGLTWSPNRGDRPGQVSFKHREFDQWVCVGQTAPCEPCGPGTRRRLLYLSFDLALGRHPGTGVRLLRLPMSCTLCWAMTAVALLDAGSLADGLLPGSGGNPWGPAASRARGDHPVVWTDPVMKAWDRWGRGQLRDGDVVFRLGDSRALWGFFPLSRFIARATGSRFSHAGVVAVERGELVVYQAVSLGVQRQPFAVWMQDNIGAFGVKRLKPEQRHRIPSVLAYCRRVFEAQVPFDRGFRLGDDRLYCVELVEMAFRSAGLPLSEPVQIGSWKNLGQFPLTTLTALGLSGFMLDTPITLDQLVFVPGDDRQGLWGSRWLETVAVTEPAPAQDTARPMPGGFGVRGDAAMLVFFVAELRSFVRTARTPLTLIGR